MLSDTCLNEKENICGKHGIFTNKSGEGICECADGFVGDGFKCFEKSTGVCIV